MSKPFTKTRLMPSELATEIAHRVEERLAALGYTDKHNTHPDIIASARNEAELWAREHYPETFRKMQLGMRGL